MEMEYVLLAIKVVLIVLVKKQLLVKLAKRTPIY